MDQPAWLEAAWAELGVREVSGAAHNPRVVAYYREAGHAEVARDEVPWCAAFAGAMLMRAGIAPSGSLMARSYLSWGAPLDNGQLGALVVLERGSDPSAGHIGFWVGQSAGRVFLLGGNQSDAVSVAAYEIARVLAYRWPAPLPATPITAENLSQVPKSADVPRGVPARAGTGEAAFDAALASVLELEGGYSDDPYDPGGPTNRGITLAVFARFRGVSLDAVSRPRVIEELKAIPEDDVRAIYRSRYWGPAQCPAMSAGLALFHFDAAVNHGVRASALMLQRALGVDVDGEIGPLTLRAIAKHDQAQLLEDYAAIRRDRYRALPHFWRFGRGWLKRVEVAEARAKALVACEHDVVSDIRKGGLAMTEEHDVARTGSGKWWAQSKTVWGALISAAATVLPALGPLIGLEVTGEVIRQAGDQTLAAAQAIAGLVGTLLTLYGRFQATVPLTRRQIQMRL